MSLIARQTPFEDGLLDVGPDTDHVSLEETNALLDGGLAARTARLALPDMMSTEEAARLNSASRMTIDTWIDQGRAIGLTQDVDGFRLPRWQFEAPLWGILPQLSEALGTSEGWAILGFLETPLGALQGATPRIAIERGETERVLRLAMHDAG